MASGMQWDFSSIQFKRRRSAILADIISLKDRRERQQASEHARALVLHECAAQLARQAHPGLLKLIAENFGADFIESRVRDTITPRRVENAPQYARAKEVPAR